MSYSLALYQLSETEGCEDEIYEAAVDLNKCLVENPLYIKVISSPVIDKNERLGLLRELLKDSPVLLRNTVLLLYEKNEISFLLEILDSIIKQYRDKNGIVKVTAISAVALSEDIRNILSQKLESALKKKIILENDIDRECLGGLKLLVDGKLFDGSVSRQLDELEQVLLAGKILIDESGEENEA